MLLILFALAHKTAKINHFHDEQTEKKNHQDRKKINLKSMNFGFFFSKENLF
jgi:hypothetical protein